MNNNKPTIAIIGAGLSGIAMGHYLKKNRINAFTIFEKSDAAGGTWHSHTYPGLSCDVPSHVYSYSFDRNPNWSRLFAPQKEIEKYFQSSAERHGIEPYIRFETPVKKAEYDGSGCWNLELENGERHEFQYLISATGNLFEPAWPKIPGIDEFTGVSWHSARWNHEYDLEGKTVVVVGSGASAAQVVPYVASKAKKLYAVQRTPYWVMPCRDRAYTPWQKWKFRWIPFAAARHRTRLAKPGEKTLQAIKGDQEMLEIMMRVGKRNMSKHVTDPEMQAALTPSYPPGCKRTLVSDDYFPALVQDNVELIMEAAVQVTADGLVTSSGRAVNVDAIVYCTGYRLPSYDLGAPVVGREGLTVGQTLKARPEAYRGVAFPGFPNYFMINGPNGVLGYTSVTISSELAAEYIARLIREAARRRIMTIEVRDRVTTEYNQAIQKELEHTTWAYDCNGFYSDRAGRVISFFPGDAKRLRRELRECALVDFEQAT